LIVYKLGPAITLVATLRGMTERRCPNCSLAITYPQEVILARFAMPTRVAEYDSSRAMPDDLKSSTRGACRLDGSWSMGRCRSTRRFNGSSAAAALTRANVRDAFLGPTASKSHFCWMLPA
jgi:hypothetical protein